jgi:transketolase
MRNRLIDELTEVAEVDERVILLTADLGFGVVDTFRSRHPNRFINVGVAEQAMIATATGLAHAGLIPYCYSIATFASLRGFEFIRNGPVAHQLPVRILGVGPGFDYENDGLSHYAIDDLAVLRSQPYLQIWAPANDFQLETRFGEMHSSPHPVYVRLPRKSAEFPAEFTVNRPHHSSILLLIFGDALPEALDIYRELTSINIQVDVHHAVWMGSESEDSMKKLIATYQICITVETHYSWSGFGSWILELGRNLPRPPRVIIHGIESLPIGKLGSRAWLASKFMNKPQVTANQVADAIGNL